MPDAIQYRLEDEVAVLDFDDGKANALTPAALTSLTEGLVRAKDEASAVVIAGRPGRFCAGFDLKIMGSGAEAAVALVTTGCNALLNLYEHPQPVVAACTGHAMAGGAVLLLCSDHRVGAEGDFSIGLNEVKIGMPVPIFVSELARERLSTTARNPAILMSRVYSPAAAAACGFLDELTSPESVVPQAIARAQQLAEGLDAAAFASTKKSLRDPLIQHVRGTLDDDMKRVVRDGTMF
ncbi:MAG: crotonase/enoyl-CoA hydratase family protein [Myxococcota bacterium]